MPDQVRTYFRLYSNNKLPGRNSASERDKNRSEDVFSVFSRFRLFAIVILFAWFYLGFSGTIMAQCGPGTPSIDVDLSLYEINQVWESSSIIPSGPCCGIETQLNGNWNCIELVITLPHNSSALALNYYTGGQGNIWYYIDCQDRTFASTSQTLRVCNSEPGSTRIVTFCRTGQSAYSFRISPVDLNEMVTLPPFDPVCVNSPAFNLTGGMPMGGYYLINDFPVTSFIPSNYTPGTHQITYVYEDEDTGCVGEATQNITVLGLPAITWNGLQECNRSSGWIDLEGSATPTGGNFSMQTGNLINNNQFNLGAALPGDYQITYTTQSNGCTASRTANLRVHPLPTADAGLDISLYQGNSALLQGTVGGDSEPFTYVWTPGSLVVDSVQQITETIALDESIEFTFTVTDSNGCIASDRVEVNVIGGNLTIIGIRADPPTICAGDTTSLWVLPSGAENYEYLWEVEFPEGVWNTVSTERITLISPTESATYRITITDANNINAPSVSASLNVSVYDPPVVNWASDLSPTVCANTPGYALSGGEPAGGIYSLLNSSLEPLSYPYINFNNFLPHHVGEGNYHIQYVYTDINGCSNTITRPWEILPYVKAQFYTHQPDNCLSHEVSILNTTIGAQSYEWNFDGTGYADPNTSAGNFTYIYDIVDDITDYTIHLTARNNDGCSDTQQRTIKIFPTLTVDFTADIDEGCTPLEVNFTNQSDGSILFQHWTFGDGTSSFLENPSHQFYNPSLHDTIYEVTLTIVSTNFLCSETISKEIKVFPHIEAGFAFSPSFGCSPLVIDFSDTSIGADTVDWDFDGGTEVATLQYFYENNGLTATEHIIKQKVSNRFGCSDSIQRALTVFPYLEASFTADVQEGCADLVVQFTNTSTLTAQQFYWDFGDEGTSSEPNPKHTFTNTSDTTIVFYVELKVISAYFCEDYYSIPITVHPYLKADFTFNPAESCSNPHEVTFINNSHGADNYYWDFGNGTGTFSASSFTHEFEHDFSTPQIFTIELIVTNTQGCSDTLTRELKIYPKIEAAFTPSVTSGCNTLLVDFGNNSTGASRYLWDFGDGGSSAAYEPTHIFENTSFEDIHVFDVWLYVESDYLCRDSIHQQITVYPAIKADFSIETVQGCSPFTVSINNHAKGASQFRWITGDGDILNLDDSPINHTYYNTDTTISDYTIILEVENGYGCMDSLQQTITVFPEVNASISAIVTEGCHPLEVAFGSNPSVNGDYFEWTFGDNKNSTLPDPVHTFFNLDQYVVSEYEVILLATSVHGCFHRDTLQISVFPKPIASFTVENSDGCSPEVQITNTSRGNNLLYAWDFGDNHTDNIYNNLFTHTYRQNFGSGAVTHTITLTSTDNTFSVTGCRDTLSQQVVIYPAVIADFTSDISAGCHPLTVNFTNASLGANATEAFIWTYGEGNSSTLQNNHAHIFRNFSHTTSATYDVMLVAQNRQECRDTIVRQITVHPKPLAFFNIPHIQACAPYEINVHNFSVGATQYDWNMADGTQYTYNTNHFQHIFNRQAGLEPGIYRIELDVDNNHGCTDSYFQQITIYPEVTADYTTDLEGCHPHTTIFNNNSIGAEYFYWNFDNGNTAQSTHPTQTFRNYHYEDDRVFSVSLRSESRYGCFAEQTQDVVVRPVPDSNFELSHMAGCSPFAPEIYNLSIGAATFEWDFQNGTSDEDQAVFVHTWRNQTEIPANYTASLIARSIYGCESTSSQIIQVFPEVRARYGTQDDIWEGCSPLEIQFQNHSLLSETHTWSFADGHDSKSANPVHKFFNTDINTAIFPVEMIARSIYGCTDTLVRNITVLPSPRASFVAQPYSQPYPNATITATNLTNPGNWSFRWEMGDGNTIHTQSFDPLEHTYIWNDSDYNSKTYVVALIASNEKCTDTYTQLVTITSPVPRASFASLQSGCEPFPVNFANLSRFAHSFRWDFDDGAVSTEPNPTHTFFEHGVYNVRLIAIGDGGRDTIYRTIEVLENPKANFEIVSALVKIPEEPLELINTSTLGDFYLWDFGDGNTSNAFEPVHYYRRPGIYDITLLVTRGTQPECHDTIRKNNAVRADETCQLVFPNAFKPGKTGPSGGYYDMGNPSTEIFHPLFQGIEEYALEIYNRWGELIFRSDDINIGWDGYHKGQLSKMDVYVWKVTGRCTDGSSIIKAGDVTLYR